MAWMEEEYRIGLRRKKQDDRERRGKRVLPGELFIKLINHTKLFEILFMEANKISLLAIVIENLNVCLHFEMLNVSVVGPILLSGTNPFIVSGGRTENNRETCGSFRNKARDALFPDVVEKDIAATYGETMFHFPDVVEKDIAETENNNFKLSKEY
ncbi:hypothetical protein KSS87_018601 [Heliosperma pusillum]|nr:hypothetical protein KSS87_018601 [Heliosperma pusillum]